MNSQPCNTGPRQPNKTITASTTGCDKFKITDIFPVYRVAIVTAGGVFCLQEESLPGYPGIKLHKFEGRGAGANMIESLEQKKKFQTLPTAEQVFYYIYALLFSTGYRREYGEELTVDFPRVPITPDYGLFIDIAKIGERLAAIHLLESPELNHLFSNFEGPGNGQVTNVSYEPSKNRIYINNNQYFSNITPDLWEYRMCGYRVMAKWLKSRKGECLNPGEIDHYRKIARIIQLTIHYQEQIDPTAWGRINAELPLEGRGAASLNAELPLEFASTIRSH